VTIEEIKALGAPFPRAEVQTSLRKKIARLVLLDPHHINPTLDLPVVGEGTVYEVGADIIAAAGQKCLLDENSVTAIVDLDSAVAN
jgi:hypothetical protein